MNEFITTEMHTAGEPVRIIEKGYPDITGDTILQKISTMRKSMDDKRVLLMHEPRGHFDMYGALLVSPDIQEADVGVIFMHNEGYSTMCGHAVISLGRYLIDKGIVQNPTIPETKINIQCPCGLVETHVKYDGTKTGSVRFQSVPAYVYSKDVSVDVPGYGSLVVDIVYGGAFYALVPVSSYKLTKTSPKDKIKEAAGKTTDVLRKQLTISHPESDDLAFLYGTIVTDDTDDVWWNFCVFAENEVDRSPCGSGTTARVAQKIARGDLMMGETKTFQGPSGGLFVAKAVRTVQYYEYEAVVVEVTGNGYYTGISKFTLEEGDDIGRGFLLV